MYNIKYDELVDKIRGCWYGKCLGGAAGAPVEGIKKIIEVNDFSEIFNPDLPNDDLDLQLLWIDVMKEKGTVISPCDLADAWVKKCWYPFSEYGYFLKNYMRGVKPPYTGIINNSFFKEGMGCPIRSEIWGIISAGNPELAAEYAYMDACLDHADNSVWAEQFMAAVESAAFFEHDIKKLISIGMEYVPKGSRLYKCFNMIIEMYDSKASADETRHNILCSYSHPDFTNVVQNMGFILIALLWGGGDMRKTINTALRCGYDTDCTCASAASVIGIIIGYNGLDNDIKELIKDYFICGIDIKREANSISYLAEETAQLAMQTPNKKIKVTAASFKENRPKNFNGFDIEYPTENGLSAEIKKLSPIRWEIYGPYFEQLNQPINPNYPSPHSEGCVLPDIVCMVNNEVFLEKKYIKDFSLEKPSCVINAYEDKIDIDKYITMQGQMCCYAKAKINSPKNQKVWLIIGNSDGFKLDVNGKTVLEKDEIRLYTPYNNFTLIDLDKGENDIQIKLLRRTEKLEFAIGFRIYDGSHWHRSKWCTDLT